MDEERRINTQINLLRERARLIFARDKIEYNQRAIREATTHFNEDFNTYKSITDLQDLEEITQISEKVLDTKQKIQADKEQMIQLKKQVKELEDRLGIKRH